MSATITNNHSFSIDGLKFPYLIISFVEHTYGEKMVVGKVSANYLNDVGSESVATPRGKLVLVKANNTHPIKIGDGNYGLTTENDIVAILNI